MPANVIFSDPNAASAAFFGRASNKAINYIQDSVDKFCQNVGVMQNNIVERVRDNFNNYMQGDFARKVTAIRGKLATAWQSDVIRPMVNIQHVQQARPAMARWVMANPTVRRYYQNDRIEGYDEDTYLDNDPNSGAGPGNYDYDVISSGVVQRRMMDGKCQHYVRHAINTKYEEEYTITMDNKLDVAHTWNVIDATMAEDTTDPTSSWNGTIR